MMDGRVSSPSRLKYDGKIHYVQGFACCSISTQFVSEIFVSKKNFRLLFHRGVYMYIAARGWENVLFGHKLECVARLAHFYIFCGMLNTFLFSKPDEVSFWTDLTLTSMDKLCISSVFHHTKVSKFKLDYIITTFEHRKVFSITLCYSVYLETLAVIYWNLYVALNCTKLSGCDLLKSVCCTKLLHRKINISISAIQNHKL